MRAQLSLLYNYNDTLFCLGEILKAKGSWNGYTFQNITQWSRVSNFHHFTARSTYKTISAETLSQRQLGKTPLCTDGGDGGEDVDHRSPETQRLLQAKMF